MLETSKDILYIVIAFCVLWVTVFMCWMFYYVAKILRNTSAMVEEFRMKLYALTETINSIRGKVEHMSSLMTLGSSGVSGFVKKMASKTAKKVINKSTSKMNSAAKDAVDKAIKKTAKGMNKASKKIKKK
jgi:hypothetical protein